MPLQYGPSLRPPLMVTGGNACFQRVESGVAGMTPSGATRMTLYYEDFTLPSHFRPQA